jgi:predicted ribosome quality control (RQC) complex YloA/Tae2 family protein
MRQLTSLDFRYLLKEIGLDGENSIISAKCDKFYISEEKELLILMHIPNRGKKILRAAPGIMYLSDFKEEMPEKPHAFAQYLRKHLASARIRQARQLGFERIIEFVLSTKDGMFRLIIELFGKGNIVLCNEDFEIIAALEYKSWGIRDIKQKAKYDYPKKEYNFLTITKDELSLLFEKSSIESAVKILAVELGLGGVYAEELCLNSGIDKNKKPNEKEIGHLHKAIEELRNAQLMPNMAYDGEKVVDFSPVMLNLYKNLRDEKYGSFNELLDKAISGNIITREEVKKNKGHTKEAERLKRIIAQQEELMLEMQKNAQENEEKAGLIYQNYLLVTEVLEELKKARKKFNMQEIKAKLKGHPLIKEVHEAKKEIVVELK